MTSIYLVDDNDGVLQATTLLLTLYGWSVSPFRDARRCLVAVQARPPACVVTDLHMPGMDGVSLAEQIHATGCSVPILIVTGAPESPLGDTARALGHPVLSKPLRDADLRRWVRARSPDCLLPDPRAEPPARVRAAGSRPLRA